jgi:hypothetical protein
LHRAGLYTRFKIRAHERLGPTDLVYTVTLHGSTASLGWPHRAHVHCCTLACQDSLRLAAARMCLGRAGRSACCRSAADHGAPLPLLLCTLPPCPALHRCCCHYFHLRVCGLGPTARSRRRDIASPCVPVWPTKGGRCCSTWSCPPASPSHLWRCMRTLPWSSWFVALKRGMSASFAHIPPSLG